MLACLTVFPHPLPSQDLPSTSAKACFSRVRAHVNIYVYMYFYMYSIRVYSYLHILSFMMSLGVPTTDPVKGTPNLRKPPYSSNNQISV